MVWEITIRWHHGVDKRKFFLPQSPFVDIILSQSQRKELYVNSN
ncbi:hypothetical protein VPHD249_0043 [Vibrio phage D249]